MAHSITVCLDSWFLCRVPGDCLNLDFSSIKPLDFMPPITITLHTLWYIERPQLCCLQPNATSTNLKSGSITMISEILSTINICNSYSNRKAHWKHFLTRTEDFYWLDRKLFPFIFPHYCIIFKFQMSEHLTENSNRNLNERACCQYSPRHLYFNFAWIGFWEQQWQQHLTIKNKTPTILFKWRKLTKFLCYNTYYRFILALLTRNEVGVFMHIISINCCGVFSLFFFIYMNTANKFICFLFFILGSQNTNLETRQCFDWKELMLESARVIWYTVRTVKPSATFS